MTPWRFEPDLHGWQYSTGHRSISVSCLTTVYPRLSVTHTVVFPMAASVDPRLLDALCKHPSIASNQRLVCTLLAVSKSFAAAVTEACRGQLTVQLAVQYQQQHRRAIRFASWFQRHASLVRNLELLMYVGESHVSAQTLDTVAAALLQVASQHGALKSFVLLGCMGDCAANSTVLAALPRSLTSLRVELKYTEHNRRFEHATKSDQEDAERFLGGLMQLPQLTGLRSLGVSCAAALQSRISLQPLAALRCLSSLQVGPIHTHQLQDLPPQLAQLKVVVQLQRPSDIGILADWFKRSLHVVGLDMKFQFLDLQRQDRDPTSKACAAASKELTTAVAEAALSAGGVLPLGRWHSQVPLHETVYAQLALCCKLQDIYCWPDPSSVREIAAICSNTSLRSMNICGGHLLDFSKQAPNILEPLSMLTELTRLRLSSARPVQLKYLPSQLQELVLYARLAWPSESPSLDLAQLTAMTKLEVNAEPVVDANCVLPPSLQYLHCTAAIDTFGPILELGNLQHLMVSIRKLQPSAGAEDGLHRPQPSTCEMQQLSTLTRLRDVQLYYLNASGAAVDDGLVATWATIPLRSLEMRLVHDAHPAPRSCPWPDLRYEIDHGPGILPNIVVHGLRHLTRLYHLRLYGKSKANYVGIIEATPTELAASLHQLSKLQHLVLDFDRIMPDDAVSCSDSAEYLRDSIVGMPSLRSCNVKLRDLGLDVEF